MAQKSLPHMVLDVGSFTISYTIYESLSRHLAPLISRHFKAHLGDGVIQTGLIMTENVEKARFAFAQAMARAKEYGVPMDNIHSLATAALRLAQNGAEIVSQLDHEFGTQTRILSGEEEAYFAALGMLAEYPQANGIGGDLGGSSLELTYLENGAVVEKASLAFGHLTFQDLVSNRKDVKRLIDQGLMTIPWLNRSGTPNLYLTGGAWRTLGRLHMAVHNHPIENVHYYTLTAFEALNYFESLTSLRPDETDGLPEVNSDRQSRIPIVALMLMRVMQACQPKKLYFCANGLRQGFMYNLLSDGEKAQEPLDLAIDKIEKLHPLGSKIQAWVGNLAEYEDENVCRLVRAACYLCDISQWDHEKYKPLHALLRSARWDFLSITHGERAFLGLVMYCRYGGKLNDRLAKPFVDLLAPAYRPKAEYYGHILRLACLLSQGPCNRLDDVSLVLTQESTHLEGMDGTPFFEDEELIGSLNKIRHYRAQNKKVA